MTKKVKNEMKNKNEMESISEDHKEKDIRTCGHLKLQKYKFPEW